MQLNVIAWEKIEPLLKCTYMSSHQPVALSHYKGLAATSAASLERAKGISREGGEGINSPTLLIFQKFYSGNFVQVHIDS